MKNTAAMDPHRTLEQAREATKVAAKSVASLEKEALGNGGQLLAKRLDSYLWFLDQLDASTDEALTGYSEKKESDLEELRQVRREIGTVRKALLQLCAKHGIGLEPEGDKANCDGTASRSGPGD